MDTNVRHESAPMPMGCRWCGVDDGEHGIQSSPGHPDHEYEPPTRAQVDARLPFNLARQRNRAPAEQALTDVTEKE